MPFDLMKNKEKARQKAKETDEEGAKGEKKVKKEEGTKWKEHLKAASP